MQFTQAHRERLIVTADDYGIRETVEPILRLARLGKLDRVAVMSRYVTETAAKALLETGVRIDLHLELIELLGRGHAPGESSGRRLIAFLACCLRGGLRRESVRAEWERQLVLFYERFGRWPDGLNSHEHVHYFPPFFPVVLDLARAHGIPFVRLGRFGVVAPARQALAGSIIHWLGRFAVRLLPVRETAIRTSDYLADPNWTRDADLLAARFPQTGTVELVVHPEHPAEMARILEHISTV